MKPNTTTTTTRARGRAALRVRSASQRVRPSLRLQERRERLNRVRGSGSWVETLAHAGLTLTGVALLVSCVVSLLGNVMLESTRRSGIQARAQLRSEAVSRRELKLRVANLAGGEALDRWALDRGMIAPDVQTSESTLVARH